MFSTTYDYPYGRIESRVQRIQGTTADIILAIFTGILSVSARCLASAVQVWQT